jgi:hypothetical protein
LIRLSMSKENIRDQTSFDLFLDAQSLLKMLGMTGAMTLGIMTFSIMTFSIRTLNIRTLSMVTIVIIEVILS